MTFEEKFEEIRKAIPKTKRAFDFDFAIQVDMTDEDCHGTFYVAYREGHFAVEPYDYRDRSARIIADSAVLMDVLKGKEAPEAAYERKALVVDGDIRAARELAKVCKKGRKTGEAEGEKTSRTKKTAMSDGKAESTGVRRVAKGTEKAERSRAKGAGGGLKNTPRAAGAMAGSVTGKGSVKS